MSKISRKFREMEKEGKTLGDLISYLKQTNMEGLKNDGRKQGQNNKVDA